MVTCYPHRSKQNHAHTSPSSHPITHSQPTTLAPTSQHSHHSNSNILLVTCVSFTARSSFSQAFFFPTQALASVGKRLGALWTPPLSGSHNRLGWAKLFLAPAYTLPEQHFRGLHLNGNWAERWPNDIKGAGELAGFTCGCRHRVPATRCAGVW
eukprot:457898-Rhodomonas_salina.1